MAGDAGASKEADAATRRIRSAAGHLDRVEAQAKGKVESLKHSLVATPPSHLLKAVRPKCVQTQIQQAQPCMMAAISGLQGSPVNPVHK